MLRIEYGVEGVIELGAEKNLTIGGYIAGRLRTNGIPSGAISGIAAGFILMFYIVESSGDWPRSLILNRDCSGCIVGI